MKILFLVTEDWYFCSHRLPLARGARDSGAEVLVACRVRGHGAAIRAEGFRLLPLSWRRSGQGLAGHWRSLREILDLYRRERPDLVHHVALKPVVFGGLAAALAAVPARVSAVAGLGHAFTQPGVKAGLMRFALRLLLRPLLNRRGSRVIVQNPDDGETLVRDVGLRRERLALIPGSGVDTHRFRPLPEPAGPVAAAMVSRMLWSKGVGVAAEAARLLRQRGTSVTLVLAGEPDPDNAASVREATLREWHAQGLLQWRGRVEDIPALWSGCHIAVLPSSYGEGIPMSLLEAAACARPIVTTDAPGCRELVSDGETGLLVPERDPAALADAIQRLVEDAGLRHRLGAAARRRVEARYGEAAIVRQTLSLYRELVEAQGEGREIGK